MNTNHHITQLLASERVRELQRERRIASAPMDHRPRKLAAYQRLAGVVAGRRRLRAMPHSNMSR